MEESPDTLTVGFPYIKEFSPPVKTPRSIESTKLKKCFSLECRIDTQSDKIVSWTRPIRNLQDKQDFREIMKNYEVRGIIEPSTSMWCHPVVLTRKNNGDLRLCIDLRRLNYITTCDNFPIPKIQKIIYNLDGKYVFSTLDLKDGFFQVSIREEDKQKTAFFVDDKVYQFVMSHKDSKTVQHCFNEE